MNHLTTPSQLQQLLIENEIDTTTWGQGQNKSLDDLWQEMQAGETTLEKRPLRRVITFVQIIIRFRGNILIETEQEMANGARRERNRPPSEKMQPGETVDMAALRGLQQELNLSPEQIAILSPNYKTRTNNAPSQSYPGLATRYTIHTIEATAVGLPLTDFTTTEGSPTDPVRKHFWRWLPEIEAEDLI